MHPYHTVPIKQKYALSFVSGRQGMCWGLDEIIDFMQ